MSIWDDDENREQSKRDERRQYEADVFYNVWRSGRDPDSIDYDRVSEHFHNGDTTDTAAAHELRIQRQAEERRRELREQEEQIEEQEPDEPTKAVP